MTAKPKPRRKRQKYRPGDYFTVRLPRRRIGYGRVLWISEKMGPLAEFYSVVDADVRPLSRLRRLKAAFHTFISDRSLKTGRWKVIAYVPIKIPPKKLPRFVMVNSLQEDRGQLVIGDEVTRKATKAELARLPRYAIWSDGIVEKKLDEMR